jgi:hypothetical protein
MKMVSQHRASLRCIQRTLYYVYYVCTCQTRIIHASTTRLLAVAALAARHPDGVQKCGNRAINLHLHLTLLLPTHLFPVIDGLGYAQ